MGEGPEPIDYAAPATNRLARSGTDRTVNLCSGIQLIPCGGLLIAQSVLTIFERGHSAPPLQFWQLGYAILLPAYMILSATGFAGSTRRFIRRRVTLYRTYAAGFFLSAAMCVGSAFAEERRAGEAFNLNELYGIPLMLLVVNPALVVILFRWSFDLLWLVRARPIARGFPVIKDEPASEETDSWHI